jgi:hypothetical protein
MISRGSLWGALTSHLPPRLLHIYTNPQKLTGRKRKEVNYNEEKVIPAIDSDDEGKGGGGGGKKGRMSFLSPKVLPGRQPLPTRRKDGTYNFADHPEFRPNLSPREVRARVCVCVCVRVCVPAVVCVHPVRGVRPSVDDEQPAGQLGRPPRDQVIDWLTPNRSID